MSNKVRMANPNASRTFQFKKDFIIASPDSCTGPVLQNCHCEQAYDGWLVRNHIPNISNKFRISVTRTQTYRIAKGIAVSYCSYLSVCSACKCEGMGVYGLKPEAAAVLKTSCIAAGSFGDSTPDRVAQGRSCQWGF
jgi:hypothetical protein